MNDPSCFCDLVALDALDLLEESDRQSLQTYLTESSDLRTELEAELADFRAAAAAIAYASPMLTPPPALKNRLFQRLNLPLPEPTPIRPASLRAATASTRIRNLFRIARQTALASTRDTYIAVRDRELVWQPYKVSGVTVAPIYVDLVKREVAAVLKAEPGVSYPQHRHRAVEEIYMLEGDLMIDGQVYGAGDYIRSLPGSIHGPSTVGGCRFFVRTSLDDEYLDEQEAAFASN